MTDDLTRFYNLLGVLAARPEQGKPLSQYTGRVAFPARGVYFFIEPGEHRASNPTARRVVRVGTHAVTNFRKVMPAISSHCRIEHLISSSRFSAAKFLRVTVSL
jgi:hypothetical protein